MPVCQCVTAAPQIDRSTVKIVVWFDNDHGYANRIVDLVRKCYEVNANK